MLKLDAPKKSKVKHAVQLRTLELLSGVDSEIVSKKLVARLAAV